MEGNKMEIDKITEIIIGCAFNVSNTLGVGFLEKVYENALAHDIREQGLDAKQQHRIQVHYNEAVVGDYVADMLVGHCVIVEIKAVKELDDVHMPQCLNYLKATNMKVCLLINFGKKRVQIKRIVNNY